MDASEFNKFAGAGIGALLVFLLLGFFGDLIYRSGGEHAEEEPLAFAVDLPDEEPVEEEEDTVDLAALAADADPAAGEKVFAKCKACHQIEDGANGVGPHLWNVVGREIAAVEDYSYSDALTSKEGEWDLTALSGFFENPSEWAPGTKMGFSGLSDPEDRVNVIAYLNEAGDSPIELAPPPTEEPAAAETEGAEDDAAAEQETAASGDDFAPLLAAADAGNGEKIFRRCQACHKIEDGANGVGPHLWGVVGRDIASVESYGRYSDALKEKEGTWTLSNLSAFLENPMEWAPGTSMGFAGLSDPQDRVDVIVYLNEADGTPIDLGAAGPSGDTETAAASDEAPADAETPAAEDSDAAGDTPGTGEAEAMGAGEAADSGDATAETAAVEAESEPATAETGTAAAADETETAAVDTTEQTGTADADQAQAATGGEYTDLLAAKDPEAGEKVFRRCQACHKVEDGANGVGPHLWDVVGREIASVESYGRYSDALSAKSGSWTLDKLMAWLEKPQDFASGTNMAFPGLRDPQDRINVIAYLNQADGTPVELGATPPSDAGTSGERTASAADQPADSGTESTDQADSAAEAGEASETSAAGADSGATEMAAETSGDTAADATEVADGEGLASLVASADPENGKKVFRKCRACHRVNESKNLVGPHLMGVVGREIASVGSYNRYSAALKEKQGEWTLEKLSAYIEDPMGWAPGTMMGFAGIKDAQDRIDLITYLNQAAGGSESLQ